MLPKAIGTPCVRCGLPMLSGQDLELDHTDDRSGYLGFAHSLCNSRAGGRKGQAMQAARRQPSSAPRSATRW